MGTEGEEGAGMRDTANRNTRSRKPAEGMVGKCGGDQGWRYASRETEAGSKSAGRSDRAVGRWRDD